MSVLLVTDDADDDVQRSRSFISHQYLYNQLKELEYDYTSTSIVVESPPTFVHNHNYHRRRRRVQKCLLQHVFTYMLTLFLLTNHLHWPIIFLSLSSIKFMSTCSATTIVTSSNQNKISSIINKRPTFLPSILGKRDDQQCLPIIGSRIDRLCSRTCRTQTWLNKDENIINTNADYLPFCSNYILQQSLAQSDFLNETTESECRKILGQIITLDDDARQASALFATYMQAIDRASSENRYLIIKSDCQRAYRTWACSIRIPFFHQNRLIPPCQTICDEVERVCPTFRPSDREPFFAGQPLFVCSGGIVANSDYGKKPHCFDTCHLAGGSLQRHSVSSSPTTSRSNSSANNYSVSNFIEGIVTTPLCFDIEPLPPSSTPLIPLSSSSSTSTLSSIIVVDDQTYNHTSNISLSTSTANGIVNVSSFDRAVFLTFIIIVVLLLRMSLRS